MLLVALVSPPPPPPPLGGQSGPFTDFRRPKAAEFK